MPDENTIVVRDISPIGNEVVNMEVDDDAVEVTTVQEEFERVLVIEDYDVPQISSTLNCWVPGSSTELGVSIANLRRSPPPPYGKLGNMTKIMSPRRTPPNFQIKAGPPLKIYLNPPKLQLTKSPFLDKTRNPQPCGKVLEPTTSALASLRLQNPILEKDENEEGRETNPLLPELATETSFEISLKRKRNVLDKFVGTQNTPEKDKRVNFENNDADGQLKPKLLLDGHGRDLQGETSEEMTKISYSAAGSEASQSKPATEMEPAEEEIETTRGDDAENGSDVDIEIGREAKKQQFQGKIKPSAFICTVCNRSFKTTRALNEHFRTHSGERPYACDQCGKKFAARGAFWNHQQTHTKGRPHKCQFCDFRSVQARSMRAHVKRLHKNL
ncbi:unnamed protein product [Orchesella dallaii]|uniref:C2H2-type domain-containing protein n=1 Tax=Orchesella dallaii TaxID=48710 RepID=A0ABP1S492_9HEXA